MASLRPVATTQWHLRIRPLPGEQACGDTGFVQQAEGCLFAVLIDVLGHGDGAARVADVARAFCAAHCMEQPASVIEGLHAQLHGSVGAVADCVRIALASGELTYAGMGNITTRIFGNRSQQLVSRDGVIGYHMPSPITRTLHLTDGDLVLMYSDGISSRFDIEDLRDVLASDVEHITACLMERFGKQTDDASCLAIRYLSC